MFILVLLLQIELVYSKSINWDEFFHFSEINEHLSGRSAPVFQVPFVFLYSWVPSLPGDTIAHIQFIRLMQLPFELVVMACIFAIARRTSGKEAGLLCALLYMTGGYVFLHAFALRTDIIAAALLSVALWLLVCRPHRILELTLVVLLLGLAFIATIKSVLYAPAILGAVLLGKPDSRWRRLIPGLALAAVVAGWMLLQFGPLLPTSGLLGFIAGAAKMGKVAMERMFSGGLLPQSDYFVRELLFAPIMACVVLLSICQTFRSSRPLWDRIALLCMLAPLATVAVYFNSYPYHYSFILPPVLAACGPGVELLLKRYSVAPICLLLLLNAALLSVLEDRTVLPRQQAIERGVRQIFPNPVAYIDENGAIGYFPRAVPRYPSGWQLKGYLSEGRPIYSEALEREPVAFMIVGEKALMNIFVPSGSPDRLLAEDERTLRSNFIPHWGGVYVAGKVIPAGGSPAQIDIRIPGNYTLEGEGLSIDGRPYLPGDVVFLGRGHHEIGPGRTKAAVLRWGDHLAWPDFDWPTGVIFTNF